MLIGSRIVNHELEESDKAKTEVHNLNSSLMQPLFDQLDTVLWQCDPLEKERSALSKYLRSEGLDQRYNVC